MRADEPPVREPARIVIVRDAKGDAFLAETYLRVSSELESAGFVVRERPVQKENDPRGDAEADDSTATILIRRAANRTDVWIADHVTRKTVVRKLGPAETRGDPATLALLVLELMRASLIEPFALEPREPRVPAPPPPPEVTRLVAPNVVRAPAPRVHLGAGAGVLLGDVGTAVAPVVSIAFPIGAFRLGAFVMAPAFGATVRGHQGLAHVRQELALVELAWSPPVHRWIRPRVALGAGGYHLDANGDARAPYRDGEDGAWAFLTSGALGGSVALSSTARLVLEGRALFGFPRPVVRFASEDTASALRPSIALSTTLEVDL